MLSQVPHTFIVDLIWLKIFSFFLEIMVSHMGTSYGPQATQANEELALEASLHLTLMQHPHDKNLNCKRCKLILKLIPLELSTTAFPWTLTPWWFCYKSTPLLVMNLEPSMKVVMKLKTLPFSHGLQFLALDIIVGYTVQLTDYLLIIMQTTYLAPFNTYYISYNYELSLRHTFGLRM